MRRGCAEAEENSAESIIKKADVPTGSMLCSAGARLER